MKDDLAGAAIMRLLSGVGVIKLANVGFGFGVSVLLANALGPRGVGIYTFAISVVSIAGVLSLFGMPRLLIRETAWYASEQKWKEVHSLWTWSVKTTFILSITAMGIIYFALWSFGNVAAERIFIMVIATMIVPLSAAHALVSGALRGLHHVAYGLFPDLVLRQAILIILLLLATSFYTLTGVIAVGLYAVSSLFALVVAVWILWNKTPTSIRQEKTNFYDPNWFQTLLSFALIAGILQINNYADIILIGIFRTDEEVGIYRIAQQLSLLSVIGLQIVGTSFSPRYARLWKEGSFVQLKRLVVIGACVSLVLALIPMVVLALAGNLLIPIVFGEQFSESYFPMLVLFIGTAGFAAVGPANVVLNMIGQQSLNAKLTAVSATANIVLNIVLIPKFGIIGAASATATASLFLGAASLYEVTKALKRK
ncbi:flippase [Sulfitobacter geojensis]|uniref:flippase n=1 Tax=Sulfitobacter geojensis TaxID=1342299 RepID=UPI0004684166|nr:flippase [Sulfitobacter geojensis]KHA50143.1 hypothetical protein Z947_410 [Sulfitobacter geojensis]NYI27461.1 O-antigen/teichoic acid export membrane protein [Sulfitobacter geojensis]